MNNDQSEINLAETSGSSPPAPQKHVKRHEVAEGFKNRTWGEGIFNAISYIGVGFFGVMAASVGLTWLIKDTRVGSKPFNALTKWCTEKATQFFKNTPPEKIKASVNHNLTIATLFTGGTIATLFPIKWLEDGKAKIVQWLDKKIYGEDRVANDPHFIEAHRAMEEVPQQTWKSIFASRVTAFIATYSTSMAVGGWIEKVSARKSRDIDQYLNAGKPEVLEHIEKARRDSPLSAAGNERVQSKVWGYIVMDAMYTAITSVSLFVFTRVFAPLLGKKSDAEDTTLTRVANDNYRYTNDNEKIEAVNHPRTANGDETPNATIARASTQGRIHAIPQHEQATT